MELVLTVVALGIVATVGAGFALVPLGRWSFEHRGRRIDVVNYITREVVRVDGVLAPGSRTGGDRITRAEHGVDLPDGTHLDIEIFSNNGLTMICRARTGRTIVFDSRGAGALADPESEPAPATPIDDRWAAAGILLDDLRAHGDPRVVRSAAGLDRALRDALLRVEAARDAVLAHRTLGGDPADAKALVELRDRPARELLDAVRALHLAADRDTPADPAVVPRVHSLLARLHAEREIADRAADPGPAAPPATRKERS